MSKAMIVTIGTSIFTSASWDGENKDLQKRLGEERIREYQANWANKGTSDMPGGLYSPKLRTRRALTLEDFFKVNLSVENADEWKSYVAGYDPRDFRSYMRYSAEIATILSLARAEANTAWQTWLSEYHIFFIHDSNPQQESHVAAIHNCAYLQALLSDGNIETKKIDNLSSNQPRNLVQALKAFQRLLMEAGGARESFEKIDILISGGFKIYGLIAYGFLSSGKYRVVYQHEDSENIVILSKEKVQVGVQVDTTIKLLPDIGGEHAS